MDESRAELVALRTDHADTVNDLEAQVNQFVFGVLDKLQVLPIMIYCTSYEHPFFVFGGPN